MKILIAAGGTGGHIYPGIAVAQEIMRRDASSKVRFVGTARGLETKIIPREGFKLELIDVAALKSVSMLRRIQSLLMLPNSFLQVWRLLRKFRPDVVIGVGGYSSGPVLLLATCRTRPLCRARIR